MTTSGRLGLGVAVACLLAVSVAHAKSDDAFARLRDRATPIDSLAAFLDRYVGSCSDVFEKAQCQATTRRARLDMTGRNFFVALDDRAARLVRPGRWDPATREYVFELTPFFDASGFALTQGAPLGTDAEGHPRIPLMYMRTTLGAGQVPNDMERLLRTQNLRIELVFQPQGVWSLPGRGGRAKTEGVRARVMGVRLTNARTGEDVAVHIGN